MAIGLLIVSEKYNLSYKLNAYWVIFHVFFFKNYFGNTIRVSNSLDPDQDRHFVKPDLGSNCLQKF